MSSVQRNHVNINGSGSQSIMFAHGYGCDQNMWRAVAPAFEANYQVVLFDYVGSGNADPKAFNRTRYSTLAGYAQDVIEIIDEAGIKLVHFVGHSVSAMIGALAAIQRPELFASLIMVGPSASYINDGEYVGGFSRSDIEDLLELLDSNHAGWSAMMAPIIMGNPAGVGAGTGSQLLPCGPAVRATLRPRHLSLRLPCRSEKAEDPNAHPAM